jgi:AraC family transcriptional regulator, regulatory protein of adaptative response / DNA-3-methyladenine glycosylase II
VTLDAESCYRVLRARDARFDGLFFVAVETTGVYCRPICPARTPTQARCVFFARAAEAERAGFRACFRCRPELAPGSAPVDSVPRLVQSAVARIDAGFLNEAGVDELAGALGVTSRHLRRAMESEIGVSPVELAQTRRLALAKQLLQDTALPLAEIAFASGFSSVRRFNALFQARFGKPPSALRRGGGAVTGRDGIALRLDYRAPLAWDTLLEFLAVRAIPGVEAVDGGAYRRTVELGGKVGFLAVRHDAQRAALRARVSLSLAPKLMTIVARLRALFDLDARPEVVAEHLGREPVLAALVARSPGLRVPGAFDGFETAVRAVLGQQVSVRAATTLSGRLVERFGRRVEQDAAGLERLFPTAAALASAPVEAVAAIGLPVARARTLVELARAFAEGRLELSSGAGPESAIARLVELPGIGAWTAHYIAMRALHWSDAFPAADLGVRKALGVASAKAAEARAATWRPWRAYGVMHLWSALSQGGG